MKTNTDSMKLKKRMLKLERMLQSANEYIIWAEASLRALEKLVNASNKTTDMQIDVLLRAMVRHRGLTPKHWTTKHLIKALLEDEYGVELNFRREKAAGSPVPSK